MDRFTTACGVAISNNYDTKGSLTLANIATLTEAEIKAVFTDGTKYNEMNSLLRTQFEMRACGVQRYGMYDWLMSSAKTGMGKLISVQSMDRGPSLVRPYIMGRQMSIVNTDFWTISAGYAYNDGTYAAGQGTASYPLTTAQLGLGAAGCRILRVVTPYEGQTSGAFELDPKWFRARQRLYVLSIVAGAAAHGQWKVLASAAPAGGAFVDVLVAPENPDTTLVDTAPTEGIILIGINNVADVESFCANYASYNPTKHVPFWWQVRRKSRQTDAEYKQLFAHLIAEGNDWYKEFADTPIAEKNRQEEVQWQKEFVHACFFGRAISDQQTLALWENLEQITTVSGATVDPGTGGKLKAYRANMIGFYDQLKSCGRVKDLQNQPLNIDEFFDDIVFMHRARESSGKTASSRNFDIYTNGNLAEVVEIGIINWFKNRYGDIVRIQLTDGMNQEYGFSWKSFRLPKYGITINLIVEKTLDDWASVGSGVSAAMGSRMNFLAVLDMGSGGSMYPAILGSNRKKWTTGELSQLARIDSTFACTMENTTIETVHTSEAVTAIVECPKTSLWVENIALTTPIYTGSTANPSYTNLY